MRRLKSGDYTTSLSKEEFDYLSSLSKEKEPTYTPSVYYQEVYSTGTFIRLTAKEKIHLEDPKYFPKSVFIKMAEKTFSNNCNHIGKIHVDFVKGIHCKRCKKVF